MKPRPESTINHPELVKNQDVIAAGMIKVHGGVVTCISNESGHYRPEPTSIGVATEAFRYWGIPLSEELKQEGWWALAK